MKKPVIYALAIVLALSSCSSNDVTGEPDIPEIPEIPDNPCPTKEKSNESEEPIIFDDYFEEYFGDWDYQDVFESETYHLLEAVIDYVDKHQGRLVAYPSSNIFHQSVTWFNNEFRKSEVAVAFLKRDDSGQILISTHLDCLTTKSYLMLDSEWWGNTFFTFLELVLSSEMYTSAINKTEKVQLMVLALERAKHEFYGRWHFHIMISIMQDCTVTIIN